MEIEGKETACLDDATLLRLSKDPMSVENAEAAAHVYVCDRCRRRFEDVLYPPGESAIGQDERDIIAGFVARRCRRRPAVLDRLEAFVASRSTAFFSAAPEWRLAAAPSAGDGNDGGEAFEDVRFVFASEDSAPPGLAWRAELSVPGTAAGSALLPVRVVDGAGRPAGDGLFSMAGTELVVSGGAATIPFDRFLVGIKDAKVAYQRKGGAAAPGSLVFF